MSAMALAESQGRPSSDRSNAFFDLHEREIFVRTDRMFAVLMSIQWVAAVGLALWFSPRAWIGASSSTHIHVWTALLLGGLLTCPPVFLARTRPGEALTRHVVGVCQVLMSALLIHLSGGRIETHFHIFGSLAFLAFYRDWRVLLSATIVVATDHFLRGMFWPMSVFGAASADSWRWLEHAGWVLFEDAFLAVSIVQGRREMRSIADRQASAVEAHEVVETQVRVRTAELMEAREAALESSRLKSEFLSNMSHEIRTPMNGVMGTLGLLIDTELTKDQHEFADMARRSADALLTIVNDILDFSKIEAGKLALESIPFNLATAVDDVAELLSVRAGEKGLELIVRYDPELPRCFVGDVGRIRQVLLNLAGNAVKFTPSGHVLLEVTCAGMRDDVPLVHVAVRDTGIGIPATSLEHVFDKFTQADASTTRRFGGTGLGLAICRQLVDLMGGTMSVESEEGRGSTFAFTLPLPVSADAPAAPAPSLVGIRALVVDDNEVNRRVLKELLTRWGIRCTDVVSGPAALRALDAASLEGDPYRLAIIDYQMPEMDGLALARAIQEDRGASDTALVLLSSMALRWEPGQLAETGFAASLLKPARASLLLETLARALETRHDGRQAPPLPARQTPPIAEAERRKMRGAGLRILVAEDNVINQRVAVAVLEKQGHRVDVAANGAEAVRMVSLLPYDVVLMDCQMPELDGFEATRAIRQLPGDRGCLPIIAMTANAMQGDRERCIESGMNDYVPKPVSGAALAAIIARWVPSPTGSAGEQHVELKDLARPVGV